MLLSLALNAKIESIKSVGRNIFWQKNVELFSELDNNVVCQVNNTLMPSDGRNITRKQLRSIWNVFQIQEDIFPRPALTSRLDEVTENRRAIAHGRLKPEEVGRRYTDGEIKKIQADINEINTYHIDVFEKYVAGKHYLKGT